MRSSTSNRRDANPAASLVFLASLRLGERLFFQSISECRADPDRCGNRGVDAAHGDVGKRSEACWAGRWVYRNLLRSPWRDRLFAVRLPAISSVPETMAPARQGYGAKPLAREADRVLVVEAAAVAAFHEYPLGFALGPAPRLVPQGRYPAHPVALPAIHKQAKLPRQCRSPQFTKARVNISTCAKVIDDVPRFVSRSRNWLP